MILLDLLIGTSLVMAPSFISEFKSRIQSLQPVMTGEDAFISKKNRSQIFADLKALNQLTKNPQEGEGLRSSGFQIPARAMASAWNSAFEEFDEGSSKRAYELSETALRASSFFQALPFSEEELKASNFQKANFFFLIRDWKKARALYEALILNYPQSSVSPVDLEEAILKMIAVSLQGEVSLERSLKALRSYQAKKSLTAATLSKLETLSAKLEGMKTWKLPRTPSFQQVTKWANEKIDLIESQAFRELDAVAIVQILYVSGLINRWLNQYPHQIQPRVYLLLSRIDDWLLNVFKASLAGLYLEECARAFPQDEESLDCLATLETRTMTRKKVTRLEALSKSDQRLLKELKALRRLKTFK